MYRYRNLAPFEERGDERFLADKAVKVFSRVLNLRDRVDLRFITDDPYGSHEFDQPIAGCCPPSGKEIFILRGLDYRYLVICIVHELRHAYQRQTGKGGYDRESRERDAIIFELEINPPTAERQLIRWLCSLELDGDRPDLAA